MPSKKKNPRTPSKVSNSDQSSGLSPSSVVSSPLPPSQDQLSSLLDEASAKFPSLISRTAFVGTITGDAISVSRGGKVWLSESAMLSSSIPSGSLVSVSLSSSGKDASNFPLSALSDECAQHFEFDLPNNFAGEAGNFFALATVFPSCEVLKNGVRLSSNLSYTLGCPESGRVIFVHPIKCYSSTEKENGNQCGLATSYIALESCKELCLSPVALKGRVDLKGALPAHFELTKGIACAEVKEKNVSSPKTPSLSDAKLGSPCSTLSHASNHNKSASKTTYLPHGYVDVLDLEQVLGNESSRNLIETCTMSWLTSRSLLPGNFAIVPVLSRLCIFQVVGSKKLSPKSEFCNGLNDDYPAQDLHIGKGAVLAFSLDWGMKIHLVLPGNIMAETSGGNPLAQPEPGHGNGKSNVRVNFPKLGGLSNEFSVLKDIIVSSAVQVTVASLGLRPMKGVLLHGPPGTGKTTLAQTCALDAGVNMFSVNGPEIISQYHGETEQALSDVFNRASQASPAVVFIDELDAIAPARKEGGDELSQRMVATLLNLMDGISRNDGVLIIAATNRPDSVDPALRRPGRLDREIEIGVPSPGQRHDILLALLSVIQHSLSDKDIQDIAMATHGFVGADLSALCNEAALIRLRQYVKSTISHDNIGFDFSNVTSGSHSICHVSSQSQDISMDSDIGTPQYLENSVTNNLEVAFACSSVTEKSCDFTAGIGTDILCITAEDFEKARIRVRPSAMREVILEVPKVRWEDVGGQMEVKMQLMEAVQWPQKHKDAFERVGTRPPSGILLFGPPGCSKTLLARAVASEAGLNFLAVKGPELFSKWVGESEKAVRSLFAKARANAPSIIFFDEIDGLAITRGKESDGVSVGDRVISQLLVELDGLQQRGSVTVIAATNRPDKIDSALLRPGRFDRLLYVGPPNLKDREDIFRIHLNRVPCSSDVCISELSLLTEGCTGADISLVCREAAIAAIEESLSASEITMEHMKIGLELVQPSDVGMYENLSAKFQRLVRSSVKEDGLQCKPSIDPSLTTSRNRIGSPLPRALAAILVPLAIMLFYAITMATGKHAQKAL